jgi:hypothetical protein
MTTETIARKPMTGKLFIILFFGLLLVHVVRNVQPCILYQADEVSPVGLEIPMFPLFISGAESFQMAMKSPGGASTYAGDYLSQHLGSFLYSQKLNKLFMVSRRPYSFGGTLVFGFIVAMTCILTSKLIPLLGGKPGGVLRFVPAILILVIWNRYTFIVAEQVGLLVVLTGLCVAMLLPKDRRIGSILPFVILLAMYYLAGGVALLFALFLGVRELCVRRRVGMGLAYLAAGAVVPLIFGRVIMGQGTAEAYLALTGLDHGGIFAQVAWGGVYVFFAAVAAMVGREAVVDVETDATQPDADAVPSPRMSGKGIRVLLAGVLLATAGVAFVTLDRDARTFRQICFNYQYGAWASTILASRRFVSAKLNFTPGLCRKLNRALYEEGRLGREMFTYPQFPQGGLLLGPVFDAPFDDDTLLQLGLVDMSQRLADASVSEWGPRPVVYRLLVEIALVDDDMFAAEEYLTVLSADMNHKRVARARLARLMDGQPVGSVEEIRRIQSLRSPLLLRSYADTPKVLAALVRQNQNNKMAFEYLLAQQLLVGDLETFAVNIERIRSLGYEFTPDNYVEALTIHATQNGDRSVLEGIAIAPGVAERCQRFNALYRDHKGDQGALGSAIAREMPGSYFGYYYAFLRR